MDHTDRCSFHSWSDLEPRRQFLLDEVIRGFDPDDDCIAFLQRTLDDLRGEGIGNPSRDWHLSDKACAVYNPYSCRLAIDRHIRHPEP